MNVYTRLRQYGSKRIFFFKTWFRCRQRNMPLVFVAGDSHSLSLSFQLPFIVYHFGGSTAYNIMKENSTIGTKEKLFSLAKKINKKKDILMLVFGEIDCRIHIFRQFKKSGETLKMEQIIDQVIDNYFTGINKLKSMGINLVVYGIPPASYQKNIYKYDYYAEPKVHSFIKKTFNEKLKERCQKTGIKYLEIFYKYSDKDGFILPEYTNDGLHLNEKIVPFIKYFFISNKL